MKRGAIEGFLLENHQQMAQNPYYHYSQIHIHQLTAKRSHQWQPSLYLLFCLFNSHFHFYQIEKKYYQLWLEKGKIAFEDSIIDQLEILIGVERLVYQNKTLKQSQSQSQLFSTQILYDCCSIHLVSLNYGLSIQQQCSESFPRFKTSPS